MADGDVRALERALETDPAARERLEHAWVRAGRGWRGDRLLHNDRGNMAAEGERGVWRWLVAPLATLEIPMIYVPGGEQRCWSCSGSGWESWHDQNGAQRDACSVCFRHGPKPGILTIKPFYAGRFPVTWREYHRFGVEAQHGYRYPDWAERDPDGSFRSFEQHPVVNVSSGDAEAFCAWAGLRLLTRTEWHWAAFGRPFAFPSNEHLYENDKVYEEDGTPEQLGKLYCLYCGDKGVGVHERPCIRPRRWPWNEDVLTNDHCVWRRHPFYGGQSTAPVVEPARLLIERGVKFALRRHDTLDALEELYPARPAGASWCGLHDMAGNVWEWRASTDRSGYTALGGSYRTECAPELEEGMALGRRLFGNNGMPWREDFSRDDIGFRVAIGAEVDS